MFFKFTLGDLLGEMSALLARHVLILLALLVVMTLGYSLLDLTSERASMVVTSIAGVFIQYLVLEQMLADRRLPELTGRHYGSMFGVSILSGLGIVVGLVLLIVPGLYLSARWTLAPAYVVTEHRRAVDALGASWEATQGNIVPLMLLYFLGLLVLVGSIGLVVLGATQAGITTPTFFEAVLSNLIAVSITIGGWLAEAAAFRLMFGSKSAVESVFG